MDVQVETRLLDRLDLGLLFGRGFQSNPVVVPIVCLASLAQTSSTPSTSPFNTTSWFQTSHAIGSVIIINSLLNIRQRLTS